MFFSSDFKYSFVYLYTQIFSMCEAKKLFVRSKTLTPKTSQNNKAKTRTENCGITGCLQ